jgi:protein-S-isoprenylcysteine O-methyltransferase Ste14
VSEPAPPDRGSRLSAIAGTALFLVLAPGFVAGLVPAVITDWEVSRELPGVIRGVGALVVAAGVAVLLSAFARFALEGLGTPAPVAPTEELVVGGLYRHVRNPMYIAVLAIVAGQALLFGSVGLLVYGVVLAAVFVAFVRLYEEPTLAARYGEQYERYRTAVPGWTPRLTSPNVPQSGP